MRRALAALACVLLGGCVYSLEPFYAKESLVASPVAAGKWRRMDKDGQAERGETWEFTADRIVVQDDRGQWRALDAKYFRVGNKTFVDTFPRDLGNESPSEAYWALHRAPFHMLSRVEVAGDRVVAYPLAASERFRELAREAPFARRSVERGDYASFVFGVGAADWKAFLEQHGSDDAVFEPKAQMVFVRARE